MQKLVGMSTVSLLKFSFVRDSRIPLLVYGHILGNASFPLPSCINVNYSVRMTFALFISYMVRSNRVVCSPENMPRHIVTMYNDRSLSRSKF